MDKSCKSTPYCQEDSIKTLYFLMLLIYLSSTSTTGYVVLSPLGNYTVFENNAAAVYYCSGDESVVVWILNGSVYGPVHAQRGIRYALSWDGSRATVTSNLYIPASATNNNTEVMCKVADGTFTNVQTSNSSNLTIQGPLDAPYNVSVARSNRSFNLSWGAPFSLHVMGYPDIFNYTLCTNITIYGCKTIPSDPNCTFPRTCTSSVDFTDPSLNGTNKTIMDYGDTIVFTFFAINGAGNGNMANFTYLKAGKTEASITTTSSMPMTSWVSLTSYSSSIIYSNSKTSNIVDIYGAICGVSILIISAIVGVVCLGIYIKCKHKDHLENIQMEVNHAYDVVNKRTPSDIKNMEPCPAYGVVH